MLLGNDLLCQFRRGILTGFSILGVFVCGGFFFFPAEDASAQQITNMSADQLMQLQQQAQQGRSNAGGQSLSPQETILEPNAPSNPQLPISRLEQILSSRAGIKLTQFGYDQMGVGRSVTLPQMGAVQDDYILGPGDEVVVSLRGQENSEYRVTVDRDGRVVLPRLNPVSASGRTLQAFRQELVAAIHRAYVSTEGFVSVGKLRQISVLVSGEVGSPGVRTLTGLSAPVDAILISGGVKKSGSLRVIRIIRDGHEIAVDLYSVLVDGVRSKRVVLADGDKIIVPPIGATVAIAGQVRQPGIYEFPAGRKAMSVREAVSLASGTILPGAYAISLLRTMPDGKRQFVDVTNATDMPVHGGEVVFVKSSVNVSVNQVKLVGAVRTPGTYALGKYRTLHDVLKSREDFESGAYMLFGIIDRTDPTTLQRTAIPFSPLRVLAGKDNPALMSDDIIHILTKDGMHNLLQVSLDTEAQRKLKSLVHADETANSPRSRPVDVTNLGSGSSLGSRSSERTVLPAGQQGGATLMSGNAVQAAEVGLGASQTTGNTAQAGTAGLGGSPTMGNTAQAGAAGSGASPTMGNTDQGGTTGLGTSPTMGNTAQGGAAGPGAPAPEGVFDTPTPSTDADLGGYTISEVAFFVRTLSEYRVSIYGGIHDPGLYMVMPGTTLAELLPAAGGLAKNVDLSMFEITSTVINNTTGESTTERRQYPATDEAFANTVLKPFDRLNFREVYSDRSSGTVMVQGEVRYPGTFDVLRNEKLSSVLRRAGGFTDVAYPDGAVFLRQSVAEAERLESERTASDTRSQLLAYLMKPSQAGTQSANVETIAALQALITQISVTPSLGRVPVVADLSALEKHPDMDITLEPGDSIVVPKKPSTVLVLGEVLRPGAQRYTRSGSSDDYIDQAGSTTEQADTSRIIVVLPDGSVRTADNSWLNFGFSSSIPPGSTIYVPRKLEVYSFRQLLTDSIQIFSQLATTAAALAVLSKQ